MSLCSTASTPGRNCSNVAGLSRGSEPSELNITGVTISRPSNRTHGCPTSNFLTSSCPNPKLALLIGSMPTARKADANVEPVSPEHRLLSSGRVQVAETYFNPENPIRLRLSSDDTSEPWMLYCAVIPPSMTSSEPVMKDDSSEARYRMP